MTEVVQVTAIIFSLILILVYPFTVIVITPRLYPRWFKAGMVYRLKIQHQLAELSQLCTRVSIQLALYKQTHARRYQTIYQPAEYHWQIAQQERQKVIHQLKNWYFVVPQETNTLSKQDIICLQEATNTFFIGWGKLTLNELQINYYALPHLEQAKQGVVGLRRLPYELHKESQHLQNTLLPKLIKEMKQEKEAGILLQDFKEDLYSIERRVEELEKVLRSPRQQSIRCLDHSAHQLDVLQDRLRARGNEIKAIHDARLRVDHLESHASSLLQEFISNTRKQNRENKYQIIIQQAQWRLGASYVSRSYCEFADAERFLMLSVQLSSLGMMLLNIHPIVDKLAEEKVFALRQDHIETSIEFFNHSFNLIQEASDRDTLYSCSGTLKKLDHQAEKLWRRHEQDKRELQHKADKWRQKLENEWDMLQGIVFMEGDELAIRRHNLLEYYKVHRGRPRFLQDFCEQAKVLTNDIREERKQRQKELSEIRKTTENLQRYAQWAEVKMKEWVCLTTRAEQVIAFSRKASDLSQMFHRSQHRNEAEQIHKQIGLLKLSATQQFEEMRKEYNLLEERLDKISETLDRLRAKEPEARFYGQEWTCLRPHVNAFTQTTTFLQKDINSVTQLKNIGSVIEQLETFATTLREAENLFNQLTSSKLSLDETLQQVRASLVILNENVTNAQQSTKDWYILKPLARELETQVENVETRLSTIKTLSDEEEVETILRYLIRQTQQAGQTSEEFQNQLASVVYKGNHVANLVALVANHAREARGWALEWPCLQLYANQLESVANRITVGPSLLHQQAQHEKWDLLFQQIETDVRKVDDVYKQIDTHHEELNKLYSHHDQILTEVEACIQTPANWSSVWQCLAPLLKSLGKKAGLLRQELDVAKKKTSVTAVISTLRHLDSEMSLLRESHKTYDNTKKRLRVLEQQVGQYQSLMHRDNLPPVFTQKINNVLTYVQEAKRLTDAEEAVMRMDACATDMRQLFTQLPTTVIQVTGGQGHQFGDHNQATQTFHH